MLHAYIDDSSQEEPPLLIYSGYVADTHDWNALDAAWKAELAAEPAIEYFKMQEAYSRTKQFHRSRFSVEMRDKRVCEFTDIIRRYVKGAFGAALPLAWYKEYVADVQGVPKQQTNKHFFLMYNVMHDLMRFGDQLGLDNGPINFTFDSQARGKRQIAEAWDSFRRYPPIATSRFGQAPEFASDVCVRPLQAADFLAWTFRRAAWRAMLRKPRESFPWVKEHANYKRIDRIWTKEDLRRYAKRALNNRRA